MAITLANRAGPEEWTGPLEALAESALKLLGVPDSVELSVVVVDDHTITALNLQYFGRDNATDVISFPQSESWDDAPDDQLLGDVVISYETAASQAKTWGHSALEEAKFLLLHGILHLLGWRDYNKEERDAMLKEQLRLAGQLGIKVKG